MQFPQQVSSTMNIGRPDVLQCDGLRAAVRSSEQIKQEKTDTNQKYRANEIEYPSFHYRIKNRLVTREVTLRQENSF